ncbi:MAG: T9SS type A sorting domain-containing protein [Rhodothermales bacterium]
MKEFLTKFIILLGFSVVLITLDVLAQSAVVSLDSDGNLLITAEMDYAEQTFDEWWAEPYGNSSDPAANIYNWLYFDIYNGNFENNYTWFTLDEQSFRNTWPNFDSSHSYWDSFLKHAYYFGLYIFGDDTFGEDYANNTTGIDSLQFNGANSYIAGKYYAGINSSWNGTLHYDLEIPFDPPVNDPLDGTLTQGTNTPRTDPVIHTIESGYGTGSWIVGPSGVVDYESVGLVSGSYEFVGYINTHDDVGPPKINYISAWQPNVPYVRFTIVDEDNPMTPRTTIGHSTSYVGEASIVTNDTKFVIESGAHVKFIVKNDAITLSSGFHAKLGSSFRTYSDGGSTSLSKRGYNNMPDAQIHTEDATQVVEPGLLSVYPNPTRGSVRIGYTILDEGPVSMVVYDILGREISVLARNLVQSEGGHSVTWNLNDVLVNRSSSGVYIVRFVANDRASTTMFTVIP